MHAWQLEVTLPEDSTLRHHSHARARHLFPAPTDFWYEEERHYRKKKCWRVINSPLMLIAKTWLYCKFYDGMKRPYQPCFSVTECLNSECVFVSMCQEEEGTQGKGSERPRRAASFCPASYPCPALSTAHCSSSPNTSFCLRFMFSKSKSLPVMRL